MPIYSTYLGFLNKHGGADKVAMKLGSCFVYYVMRNRGNNAVAPMVAELIKATREKDWETYEKIYHEELQKPEALAWMKTRAYEARIGNIVLVCYEKDAAHCHRRLLAEEIARLFNGVEYKGELEEPAHIYSLDGKPDKFDYQ